MGCIILVDNREGEQVIDLQIGKDYVFKPNNELIKIVDIWDWNKEVHNYLVETKSGKRFIGFPEELELV
jgi:hypothetical protein